MDSTIGGTGAATPLSDLGGRRNCVPLAWQHHIDAAGRMADRCVVLVRSLARQLFTPHFGSVSGINLSRRQHIVPGNAQEVAQYVLTSWRASPPGMARVAHGRVEMADVEIRAALDRYWAASNARDKAGEGDIYRDDVQLKYRQSGEGFRGH